MKMTPKNKNYLFALAALVVIIITGLLMFFPQYALNYKWGIVSLKAEKDNITNLKSQITTNEVSIQDMIQNKSNMEVVQYQVQQDAASVISAIDANEFKLNVPSLLITLENRARDNNIPIEIRYDKAQYGIESAMPSSVTDPNTEVYTTAALDKYHIAGCSQLDSNSTPTTLADVTAQGLLPCEICNPPILTQSDTTEPVDTSSTSTTPTSDDTSNTSTDTTTDTGITTEPIDSPTGGMSYTVGAVGGEAETIVTPTISPSVPAEASPTPAGFLASSSFPDSDIDTLMTSHSVPAQNGLYTMVIPVLITGKYTDISRYLSTLNNIDFIEIGYIGLKTKGETVDGIMLINIKYEGAQ